MVPVRLLTTTFHSCVGLFWFPSYLTGLFLSDVSLDPQHLHTQPWGSPRLPYDFYGGSSGVSLSFSHLLYHSSSPTLIQRSITTPHGSRPQQGLCYILWPRTTPSAHQTQKYPQSLVRPRPVSSQSPKDGPAHGSSVCHSPV